MPELRPLDLKIQDLPKNIDVDISSAPGGDLSGVFSTITSEIIYNSRYDLDETDPKIEIREIARKDNIATFSVKKRLNYFFLKLVARERLELSTSGL
ncbi:MAG: hypothetical protein HYW48_02515 [Deltaproteobacteria bacterium]|nr:hypothetical protein [Deltaproteobacteria bacterium]